MGEPLFVDGVAAFADRYDAFILDQWGVLHNGQSPYPGTLEALAELQRRAKRLVILSNSGRRVAHNDRNLRAIGFAPAAFDAVVTSGEIAWRLLQAADRPPFDRLGRRCYLITRDQDAEVLAETGIERVTEISEASFLFLAGVDSPTLGFDDYRPILEQAAARKLVAVCSNPDRWAPTAGGLVLAPGRLAEHYAVLGGEVAYVGKPHPLVYGACLDALEGLHPSEIVAIGDSLEHDVKGANGVGVAAAFVSGGLHAADFPREAEAGASRGRLLELSLALGARPDWVIPSFRW